MSAHAAKISSAHPCSRSALVLVDGFNLLWRSVFGFPARIAARDGTDVTAPFGFFALLRKALRSFEGPTECVVVFDSESGWTGRQSEYAAYKDHRRAADFSPIDWLPDIQDSLSRLDIAWQESGNWEADDVIAAIATATRRRRVFVMSTDRDFYQLLGPRVSQLNTARAATRRIITAAEITERFKVAPIQWCDYVALVGDPSDGIPGVRGIGPKRAAALLAGGLHLEDLATSERLNSAHGLQVQALFDDALRWRSLVRLRTDVPVICHPTGQPTPELPLAAQVLQHQQIW